MSRFIPSLHFEPASKKLKPEWCLKGIDYYYNNYDRKNLLHNKNTNEIDEYSSGQFDLVPFKKIFKSMKKVLENSSDPNIISRKDTIGFELTCLPLIPTKLNAAISIVHKIPIEVTCTALDALAARKKEEDIAFLKNKEEVESDLQELADQMQLGKVDLGTTIHSDTQYSSSPYGLDLTDPEELDVFENLIYSLNVESAYETAIHQFMEIKNIQQMRLLEIRDQYKYAISCNRAFSSDMTGLPDAEYLYPGDIETPLSELPDFSDNPCRFINKRLTVLEMFNYFSREIGNKDELNILLNEKEFGYCPRNNIGSIDEKSWATFKLNLVYCEIKSVDWVGVGIKEVSKMGVKFLTEDESQVKEKIWGQNTYCFWWLKNTKRIFGIERLGYAHRTDGEESYQNFSTNIYKSQEKSAVELAIGENKKAQIADIKLQHAIIKSVPAGKYIDIRYLRGALTSLKEEDANYSINDLINLAFEQNIIIGDTSGFEGKNDSQFLPVKEIPGGMKSEIEGYMRVIADCSLKISQYTGINEQLTGQGVNPEGLIGLQKLLINSSLNALNYCNEAMRSQYQRLLTIWGACIKQSVEAGGAAKKTISEMVGKKKTILIDGLEQIPLHRMGIVISLTQREEERAEFKNKLTSLVEKGIISTADEYQLKAIKNPKDAFGLLAVKEKQFLKRQQKDMEMNHARQQELLAQQGQNVVQAKSAETDGKIKLAYAKGDVESKIIQLSNDLGINAEQFKALVKTKLQRDRVQGQIEKSIKTLETKSDLENQKALQTA